MEFGELNHPTLRWQIETVRLQRLSKIVSVSIHASSGQALPVFHADARLPALASDGHRTLIFSQGVRMMDLAGCSERV